MYLEKVKAQIKELQSMNIVGRLVPCSEGEVRAIEKRLGNKLPAAYREFLLLMGQKDGGLLGRDWLYEYLEIFQEDAIELMRRDGFPVTLPADAFVFLMHDGYQFDFFCISEGDDPPVYHYIECDDEIALKISIPHYSIYIQDIIEAKGSLSK